MLFDPKWQPKELLSVAGLIAWLEQQNPTDEYQWKCCLTCLIGNYFRAMTGSKDPWMVSHYEAVFDGNMKDYHDVGSTKPWTYGAALKRARALNR